MIPAVLAAAQELEIAQSDPATIRLALETWRATQLPTGESDIGNLVTALSNWWQTYVADRPLWQIALVALSKMTNPTRE